MTFEATMPAGCCVRRPWADVWDVPETLAAYQRSARQSARHQGAGVSFRAKALSTWWRATIHCAQIALPWSQENLLAMYGCHLVKKQHTTLHVSLRLLYEGWTAVPQPWNVQNNLMRQYRHQPVITTHVSPFCRRRRSTGRLPEARCLRGTGEPLR